MNVRSGTDKMVPTNVRPMVTPYRPKVGPTVPKDSRFLHRQGKEVASTMREGTVAGPGERLVPLRLTDDHSTRTVVHVVGIDHGKLHDSDRLTLNRKTVCGGRDHAALAGKKVGRFVHSREGLDSRLDAPPPPVSAVSSVRGPHVKKRTGHVRLSAKI